MRTSIKLLFALIISALFLSASSCREKTTAEKVEDGIEEVGDEVEDGAEEIKDEAEDAVDDN